MKKIFAVSALIAVSLLIGPGRSEAADFWNMTGITKTVKVAVTLSYNSSAGLQTINYKPTKLSMKIERKLDSDDAFAPRYYTSVNFTAPNTSFNASMSGSGIKTMATTLLTAAVNNDLEDITNTSTDYPRFSFSDTTTNRTLVMGSDAMLTSFAEGSLTEKINKTTSAETLDVSMKYTVMGTVTVNGTQHYPAKISISVTAKAIKGEDK